MRNVTEKLSDKFGYRECVLAPQRLLHCRSRWLQSIILASPLRIAIQNRNKLGGVVLKGDRRRCAENLFAELELQFIEVVGSPTASSSDCF